MRLRGPGAGDYNEEEATLEDRPKGSNQYISPRFMLFIFLVCGVITWALLSYDQRAMAELLRGKPRGRKYLESDPELAWLVEREKAKDITLYVIPGGGSGVQSEVSEDGHYYPEWTKRRTVAAVEHARKHFPSVTQNDGEASATGGPYHFLALSAGSLNSPNQLMKPNQQVIFECTHIIHHLVELGVPQDVIHGDFMSWDTITNGLVVRMTVQALLEAYPSVNKVNIEVFISDFHLERMKASLEWLLGLQGGSEERKEEEPPSSLTTKTRLRMHSVSSEGIDGLSYFGPPDKWGRPAPLSDEAKAAFDARREHEKRGIAQVSENRKKIVTEAQFKSWLLLGGHRGYKQYLAGDGSYTPSQGKGW